MRGFASEPSTFAIQSSSQLFFMPPVGAGSRRLRSISTKRPSSDTSAPSSAYPATRGNCMRRPVARSSAYTERSPIPCPEKNVGTSYCPAGPAAKPESPIGSPCWCKANLKRIGELALPGLGAPDGERLPAPRLPACAVYVRERVRGAPHTGVAVERVAQLRDLAGRDLDDDERSSVGIGRSAHHLHLRHREVLPIRRPRERVLGALEDVRGSEGVGLQ